MWGHISRRRIGTALAASWLIVISACGGDVPPENSTSLTPDVVVQGGTVSSGAYEAAKRQIADLAEAGEPTGRMIIALQTHKPELYDEFLGEMAIGIDAGKFTWEQGYEIGEKMRPKFLAAFLEATEATSDENIIGLLRLATDTYEILMSIDPQECVRNVNGLAPADISIIPVSLQERETDLMIKVFEEGRQSGTRTASEEEVLAWMIPLLDANPVHARAFTILGNSTLSDSDAELACTAMSFLMSEILKAPQPDGAALFRGMAQMEK